MVPRRTLNTHGTFPLNLGSLDYENVLYTKKTVVLLATVFQTGSSMALLRVNVGNQTISGSIGSTKIPWKSIGPKPLADDHNILCASTLCQISR